MRGIIDATESLIVGPTIEPIDLDEVKKQRRFSSISLDTLFDLWISAARSYFEEETGRQLMTATWEYWLDSFPLSGEIVLPRAPLQSVVSVKYDLTDEQTIDAAAYRVTAPAGDYCDRGTVSVGVGGAWPTADLVRKAVRIRYVAGYGDQPGAVPELIKYALMMLVGHFHRFGEEVNEARANILQLPIGAQTVIQKCKLSGPGLPRSPVYTTGLIADTTGSWL